MILLISIVAIACALWFWAGWLMGIRACARQHHCIVKQAKDTQDWTGELTRELQERLARRERNRAEEARKSTGEQRVVHERRPFQDRDRDGQK